jgi:hypothetical protein
MKDAKLTNMTVDALVDRFAALAGQQSIELDSNDIAAVNRLYWELEEVEAELKARQDDQRLSLLRLYDHPNMQVRLKAVKATLAVSPMLARQKLQAIADSHEQPQAGEAGMSIRAIERGIFKPK